MILTQISRSRFKQSKLSRSYVTSFQAVMYIVGDFWVNLGKNVFLKGLVKFMEIGNFEDMKNLKLKNGRRTPSRCPLTGTLSEAFNCLVVFYPCLRSSIKRIGSIKYFRLGKTFLIENVSQLYRHGRATFSFSNMLLH